MVCCGQRLVDASAAKAGRAKAGTCNSGVSLGHGSWLLQLGRRAECVSSLKVARADEGRAEQAPVVGCNRMHHHILMCGKHPAFLSIP